MPASLAARGAGRSPVRSSGSPKPTRRPELFINEARLLAQFDHPSLVKVYRFWEANGTAYMVMPFCKAPRCRTSARAAHRARRGWIRSVVGPI